MNVEYNQKKLTNTDAMRDKKVLIIGVGAVGSIAGELLTRNCTGLVSVLDKDCYESGNLPKSSAIIRFPEDVGKSKALALAERLDAVSDRGCRAVGNHLDLKRIGPAALSGFDYVVLALDNNAMKIFASELIAGCREDKRPVYLSGGTNKEFSEAMLFVPGGACLRCTIPDEWLKSEDPELVFSCAAKVNLLLPEKQREIVSTSGIASMKCAVDMDDMILAHAGGTHTFNESERYVQHTYPVKEGHGSVIMRYRGCPVCSSGPPEDITVLPGCTTNTTLRELLDMTAEHFSGDFRLKVHRLIIPSVNITQCYQDFIISAECKGCGETFSVMRHSGLIRRDEMICPKCSGGDIAIDEADGAYYTSSFDYGTHETLLDMTLFDLGYPIGAYYEAEEMIQDDIEEEIDFLSEDISVSIPNSRFFSLIGDETYLYETHGVDDRRSAREDYSTQSDDDSFNIEIVNTLHGTTEEFLVFPENNMSDVLDALDCCGDIGSVRQYTDYCRFEFNGKITSDLDTTVKELGLSEGDVLIVHFFIPCA